MRGPSIRFSTRNRLAWVLPRYSGDEDAVDIVSDQDSPELHAGSETILVDDDDASVRALMAEMLREMGYRVLEAEDGARAVQLLQSEKSIALLVTDVGLPGGMNGRHVADAATGINSALRVLFVTGYAENAVLSHGHLPMGMQVMTKPFELAAFCQRVQVLLRTI